MAQLPVKKDSKATQRLAEFQVENARRKRRTVIGGVLVTVFSLLFFMLVSGDRFDHLLSYLGLKGIYNAEKGVYADCSKPENQSITYCQKLRERTEQNWESATRGGGGNPFTLFDPAKDK